MAKRQSAKPALGEVTEDERVRRSKQAVLAATFEILTEKGLGGLSVDEVSARSGVAKTTVYRHWPSRAALILDACSNMGCEFEVPQSGSLKGDLLNLARQIVERLRDQKFSSVLPSVIDAAERDPEIAGVFHAKLQASLAAPLLAVIDEARERREVSRACVASEIVSAVLGPLFYRRWFSREPLDDAFIKRVVERAVPIGK